MTVSDAVLTPGAKKRNKVPSLTDRGDLSVPRLVYIAGYGRSGSTLLDILLGNAPRTAGCGELWRFLQSRDAGVGEERAGQASPDFWREVLSVFRGRLGGNSDMAGIRAARRRSEGLKTLPLLMFGIVGRKSRATYKLSQRTLLGVIRETSNCEVVVDSSKTTRHCAGRPLALSRLAGVEVRVIHLVRDGRAVLWSQLRGCNVKLERGMENPRSVCAVPCTLFGWTVANLACWLQCRLLPAGRVLRVHYEELVAAPERELARIGAFAGIDMGPVIERLNRGEPIPPGPQFAGNRLRLRGIDGILDDAEWRSRLPWLPRLAYWIFCWPWHLMFCRRISSK